MSKHNYSQYSNKNREANASAKNPNNPNNKPKKETAAVVDNVVNEVVSKPVVAVEPEVIAPEVKMVKETVETVVLPETVEGVVVNCAKLNVRAEPSITGEVVYMLDTMSEIEVDMSKSTNEWLHICTATGVEGYCMRKYVDVRL